MNIDEEPMQKEPILLNEQLQNAKKDRQQRQISQDHPQEGLPDQNHSQSQKGSSYSHASSQLGPAYNPQITINESSINQMLTVLLEPGQTIWYRGQIIASNRPYSNQDAQGFDNFDLDRIMHYLRLRWNVPMKLGNNGLEMAYFCIRRRFGGGKILHLEEQLYNESFVVDMTKLLTINCDPINYNVSSVSFLPYLTKLHIKSQQNTPKLSLTLQANPGNLIYQKSLGKDQKLFVGTSHVVAMSQSIQVKKIENCVTLCGPGYVFLESPPCNAIIPGQVRKNAMISVLMTFMLMMAVMLYTKHI